MEGNITLEQAEAIAKRIEEANKQTLELLNRAEKIKVQEILSGKSSAGNIPVEISHEEKIKQEMKKYFKGTTLERAIK